MLLSKVWARVLLRVSATALIMALPVAGIAEPAATAQNQPTSANTSLLTPGEMAAGQQILEQRLTADGQSFGYVIVTLSQLRKAASTLKVQPNNVSRCRGNVCLTILSLKNSGPVVTEWHSTAFQPPNTTVCDVIGEFDVNGVPKHAAINPTCLYDGETGVAIWGGDWTPLPYYFYPGTTLCNNWAPSPPFEGRPCAGIK